MHAWQLLLYCGKSFHRKHIYIFVFRENILLTFLDPCAYVLYVCSDLERAETSKHCYIKKLAKVSVHVLHSHMYKMARFTHVCNFLLPLYLI